MPISFTLCSRWLTSFASFCSPRNPTCRCGINHQSALSTLDASAKMYDDRKRETSVLLHVAATASRSQNMSVFDQSFNQSSGCFGICNGKGDRQSPIPGLQNPLEDDLKTSEDRQKKREIDAMLSQALSGLTFEERQEQQEILHGVDRKVAEEDTFIEASLQQLESCLERIKSRSVYEMAEQMDPAYVKARAFRVMFLRGNRYDIKESAENMLRFFEMKRQLFGGKSWSRISPLKISMKTT